MPAGCSDICIVTKMSEVGQLVINRLVGYRLVRVIIHGDLLDFASTELLSAALKFAMENG
jgi:hypothetical protein